MKVDIHDLLTADIGEQRPFAFQGDLLALEDTESLRDYVLTGTVTAIGDRYVVQGSLRGNATLTCRRCLREFAWSLNETFAEEFSQTPIEEQFLATEQSVALEEMLTTVMVLALPEHPLHHPDCRGLCTVCGEDLNDQPHQHAESEEAHPFAKLKDMLE